MSRLLFLPALLATLVSGCSGTQVRWTGHQALEQATPTVVVVAPFRFRWVEPTWRSYQKSRDLVTATLDDGRFLVIGPEEFTVYRPEDPNVLASTTLLPRLMELGLTPEDAVLLRAFAEERREQSSRLTYDGQGRPVATAHREKRIVIVHLQLVDVKTGRVLLQGKQTIPFDPLATYPDYDPLQPLTEALRELTAGALEHLPTRGARGTLPGLSLVVNPAAEMPPPGNDLLDSELLQLAFFTYFNAHWRPSDRKILIRARRGARVEAASGAAAEAGLAPGDVVITCNDMPVTGPETILRHLARARTGVRLTLLRGELRSTLLLPVPAED